MDTLSSTTLIPPSALLRRFLTRLPKQTLVSLVLIWLDHPLCPIHAPPDDEDEYFMEDEESMEDKREIYAAQRNDVNITKKAVIDRILGQDWVIPQERQGWRSDVGRRGLNVLQVAMLDMQYLFHSSTAQKWVGCEITFTSPPGKDIQARPMPSLRPNALVQQLRKSLNPLMRNHIYIQSHPSLPLLVIRLILSDSQKDDLLSPRRTFYITVPSSSPYIFHTPSTDHLHEIIRQSLSSVFSTARYPVIVAPCTPAISAKSLETMMTLCGANREANSLGAWRIYAKGWVDGSPLAADRFEAEQVTVEGDSGTGKREMLARVRFGMKPRRKNTLAVEDDVDEEIVTPALERVEWRIVHGYPDHEGRGATFSPSMTMRLEGVNVFHGVYQGICEGWVDGERVPGWLTGEEGRTEGRVRDGRIEGV